MVSRECADGKRNDVRVLAVEDNLADLRLIMDYLSEVSLRQFHVDNAGRLSSALDILGSEQYDVVLLDLNLPDSAGFDTFTRIHAAFPRIPIVVLTGSTNEATATRAINEGAQDYLFKDELTPNSLGRSIIYSIERKRIELELIGEKARAELYLDLLTHDINNYIMAALGYLQLAEMRLEVPKKDQKLIEVPIRELRNSTELIANVRNIQMLEVDRYRGQPVDMRALLDEIKTEYEHPPGRDVTITLNGEGNCNHKVSSLLRDAFGNIVSNSIKHSTGDLRIAIDSQPQKLEGTDYCRINVEDNGPGIPDDMKTMVFERSTRGATKVKGHGLGLYLVKRLVEDQGGTVWVEDRVQGDHTKGARFVIMLPEKSFPEAGA